VKLIGMLHPVNRKKRLGFQVCAYCFSGFNVDELLAIALFYNKFKMQNIGTHSAPFGRKR
jgi:hypothetical protein